MFKLLPLDYPMRNLGRRPTQTLLTIVACALVAGVIVATVSFASGLEKSFADQGRSDTAILISNSATRDIVRSSISPAVADLAAADIASIRKVHGRACVSPEIQMGTNVTLGDDLAVPPRVYAAFVRGVTDRAFLVHENLTLTEGRLPGPGEAIVGRLVAARFGVDPERVAIGKKVRLEGGEFEISGVFAAPGTTIESEIWAPLHELMGLARREDISAVFLRVSDPADLDDIDVFAQRRLDLGLLYIPSKTYYGDLAAYFAPIRGLAWLMALMIAVTVVFTGANTLNTSVQDRINELATLRALGYPGRSLALALLVEALLLTATGGLAGLLLAHLAMDGLAFRIGMGAFSLDVGAAAVLVGFLSVLFLGLCGTLPAAFRVLRLPVAVALKDD